MKAVKLARRIVNVWSGASCGDWELRICLEEEGMMSGLGIEEGRRGRKERGGPSRRQEIRDVE